MTHARDLPEGLELTVEGGVATLTLNRPDRLNSLTFQIYRELELRFAEFQDDPQVSVVVLTGRGKGFCSGGDVHEIIGALMGAPVEDVTRFARMTGAVIRNMRRLRKPIVAALNGTTAGAGAVLALASDFRIASRNCKVAFLFTKVGLTGADMGAAYLLPRVVGLGRATEILMHGEPIPAEEALAMGLVHQVVEPDALEDAVEQRVRRLLEGPAFSLGMTKELLNNSFSLDLDSALDAEARAQSLCMMGGDFAEFHRAFVHKRKPRFNQGPA